MTTLKIEIQEVEKHARLIRDKNLRAYNRSPGYNVILASCPLVGYCPDRGYVNVKEDWKNEMEKHLIKDNQLL